MTITTASAMPILKRDEVRELLLGPVVDMSLAAQVADVMFIESHSVSVPRVGDFNVASYVGEGQEVPFDDLDFSDMRITPSAIAQGSPVTIETAQDSQPDVARLIGQKLAASLHRKIDAAFFGKADPLDPLAQPGLLDQDAHEIISGEQLWTPDVFLSAITQAEAAGHPIDAFVCHPMTAARLGSMIVTAPWMNGAGADITQAYRRQIQGVPIIATNNVPDDGSVWGFNKASALLVIREDATIRSDASVYFTSRRIAFLAEMRFGIGWLNAESGVYRLSIQPAA